MNGDIYRCSNCNKTFLSFLTINYCPCCGKPLTTHGTNDMPTRVALSKGYGQILWKHAKWARRP